MIRLVLLTGLAAVLFGTAAASRAASTDQGRDVAFTLQANLIVVTAEVNGVELPFIVDTGASQSLLTPAAARELGLEAVEKSVGSGAGGKVEMSAVRVRSFRLGGHSMHDATFMVMDLAEVSTAFGSAFSGVIGFDVLSRFTVTIDYRHRTLTLRPYADDATPTAAEARIENGTFTGHGITLTRPNASWDMDTTTLLREILLVLRRRGSTGRATVQYRTLHGITLAAVVPSVEASLRAQVKGFRKISEEHSRVGGFDAYSVEYLGVEEGNEERFRLTMSKPGATLYLIRLQSAAQEFDALDGEFRSLVESIGYS